MSSARTELIELIEEVDQICVDSHPVLLELVSWLPATTISTFIEDARAALELDYEETEIVETEGNDYTMCMTCQDTYYEDDAHTCNDEDTEDAPDTKYFSSRIPAC